MIVGERVISNLWIMITKCGVLSIASVDAGSGQESIRALMVLSSYNEAQPIEHTISPTGKHLWKTGDFFPCWTFWQELSVGDETWTDSLCCEIITIILLVLVLYIYSHKHTPLAWPTPSSPSFSRQLQQSRIAWVPESRQGFYPWLYPWNLVLTLG